MKFPKKVTVCGFKYTVAYKANWAGGNGNMKSRKITVGTERGDQTTWEDLVHEIMELTAVHRRLHFMCGTEIRVVMNHAEFTTFASDVAISLGPLVCKRFNKGKHGH